VGRVPRPPRPRPPRAECRFSHDCFSTRTAWTPRHATTRVTGAWNGQRHAGHGRYPPALETSETGHAGNTTALAGNSADAHNDDHHDGGRSRARFNLARHVGIRFVRHLPQAIHTPPVRRRTGPGTRAPRRPKFNLGGHCIRASWRGLGHQSLSGSRLRGTRFQSVLPMALAGVVVAPPFWCGYMP